MFTSTMDGVAEALGLDACADHGVALRLVVLPVGPALGEARVADDADDLVALDELAGEGRLLGGVELLVVERCSLIGRPRMPPLSLTQSKYAFATLPIVVKSTPGISMSMPPSLIGRPVAFLPGAEAADGLRRGCLARSDRRRAARPSPSRPASARGRWRPRPQRRSCSSRSHGIPPLSPRVVFDRTHAADAASRLPQDLVTCTLLRVGVASARPAREPGGLTDSTARGDDLGGPRSGRTNPALGPSAGARARVTGSPPLGAGRGTSRCRLSL